MVFKEEFGKIKIDLQNIYSNNQDVLEIQKDYVLIGSCSDLGLR